MIALRPVVRADLDILFEPKLHPGPQAFVAPNAVTLAEIHYVGGGYVFSIWSDEMIVGLLAMIDFREHDDLFEDDVPDAAFMLRLMIGADHQGRGHGRAAVERAIDWARNRGNRRFQTSCAPENESARRFYKLIGLRETGRIVEDEVEMSLELN